MICFENTLLQIGANSFDLTEKLVLSVGGVDS
jgi:hypothetical protein